MVSRLSAVHCTYEEMAYILGVGERTLRRRYERDADFRDRIDRSRALGRAGLRREMWALALKCASPEAPKSAATMAIFLAKQPANAGGLGMSDKFQHDVAVAADWASLVTSVGDWESEQGSSEDAA